MHLVRRKAMPVADRTRDGELYEHEHPRIHATRFLRERIADGRGGLDPYDPTVFVLDAFQHERVWANRALELTGLVLRSRQLPYGGTRFRAVLEASVRAELGLDADGAPTMDEPLASRGADTSAAAMQALEDARDAWSRRERRLREVQ